MLHEACKKLRAPNQGGGQVPAHGTIVCPMKNPPTLADAYRARQSIRGLAIRTPLVRSELSNRAGHELLLKLETLQPTGAFKLRGAANAISRLSDEERSRGVVCCSTGNHGRAVAYAARRLNTHSVVCLSTLVPEAKVRAIELLGAEVRRVGASQDEAAEEVRHLVSDEGMVDIPPFDHADVIAGQATIGIELMEERPDLETILVPLSGGGLIAGIAMAAKTIKPSLRVIGLTMERGAAMAASLEAGSPVAVEEVPSLADSLGGGIGSDNRYTFRMCREWVDEVILLSEEAIYEGMYSLLMDDRLIVEGASALGHSAILEDRVRLDGPTAIVISGRNVDMRQIECIAARRPVLIDGLKVNPPRK